MAKSLKICMLVSEPFPIKGGGAEMLTYELSKALTKKGHEVTVVCRESEGEYVEVNENLEDIIIHRILASFGRTRFLRKVLSFYNFLKNNKFDVIHAHFVISAGTLGLVGKLFGIPVIVTAHGVDIKKSREIDYGFRLNKIFALITWFTLKTIDFLVVVSGSMIKDAKEAGAHSQKMEVVYNGIDLDKILSLGGTDILHQYEITKDNFIVLYLGRLNPKKCPDDLVMAFPKVAKRVPNAKLIFAGEGEEEMKLKGVASDLGLQDKVIFTGFVSEDEKWDLLKNCDVFVLTSLSEGHPITMIEAMACGKPMVATDIEPFSEIIRDGETGLLVPLHSPDELADAIIKLALDEEKKKEMGTKAKEYVTERFSINKTAGDYLEIYAKVINRKRENRKGFWR